MKRSNLMTYILALLGITLTISMILFPDSAFEAARDGLEIWWHTVFPALLPFFIGSEILMGLGVVNFMGSLLEPLMRPLFNVPGEGSFVLAMGLASGYPIGAILTAKLRRRKTINKTEAERLISMANTADPLFIFGAVAVGFFHDVRLGAIIAAAHYLSALAVGVTMRFYKPNSPRTENYKEKNTFFLARALRALITSRNDDGRPFGQLLGDAIKQSVNSLLMIGGFIIFFSVIIKIATVSSILDPFTKGIAYLLSTLGISSGLAEATASGIFEISMGTKLCSTAAANLVEQIALAGTIIAWSGLSVHAQVAAIINDTDIDIKPYILARIWQALLAGIFTYLLISRSAIATSTGFISIPTQLSPLNTLIFGASTWVLIVIALLAIGLAIQCICLPFKYLKKILS